MGVFSEWQPRYLAAQIATFPVLIDEKGKRPLVKGWTRLGTNFSSDLARRPQFADCNGIAFRANRPYGPKITICDIDVADDSEVDKAIERHGSTKIIVRTASGKYHLWYRYNGEKRLVRPWGKNVPIDILGDGMVVAPPSVGPKGGYEFIKGGLEDLERLPPMRGIDDLKKAKTTAQAEVPKREASEALKRAVREGERNEYLFRACLKHAIQCYAVHHLMEFAMTLNATFDPPLSDSEAMGCALHAWQLNDRGRNFYQCQGFALPGDVADKLDRHSAGGDAMRLLYRLERAHWNRDQFCLSQSFAKQLGWTLNRYRRARGALVDAGGIRQLTAGGRFKGDVPVFAWPSVKKG
jgi:Bifunctional DNA primase/polymerase, N-terminal